MAKIKTGRPPQADPRPAPPSELPGDAAWRRRHLLDLDDFSAAEIELVMDTTDAMKEVLSREVPRLPTLRGTTIALLTANQDDFLFS